MSPEYLNNFAYAFDTFNCIIITIEMSMHEYSENPNSGKTLPFDQKLRMKTKKKKNLLKNCRLYHI